jgi:hypothetical protein
MNDRNETNQPLAEGSEAPALAADSSRPMAAAADESVLSLHIPPIVAGGGGVATVQPIVVDTPVIPIGTSSGSTDEPLAKRPALPQAGGGSAVNDSRSVLQAGLVSGLPAKSLLAQTEPPRGIDPARHHTDVAANLSAVSPRLEPPKALASHTGSLVETSAVSKLGPQSSAPTFAPDARSSAAPLKNDRAGNSVIHENKVTPGFLAAAADKYYAMMAEELVVTITTIVPNFAACRRLWLELNYSGAYLMLSENPASLIEKMQTWKRTSGEFFLTGHEIEAVIALLARIINQSKGKPPMSAPWIALVPDVIIVEQTPFSTLTSAQTFDFVLHEMPHLNWLQQSWDLHGLTGRELLAMHPQLLVEVLANFHQLVPGQQCLSTQQCDRVRQAVLIAMRRYSKSDNGVDAIIDEHEAYHKHVTGKYLTNPGGGATSMLFATPSGRAQSPIVISSGSGGQSQSQQLSWRRHLYVVTTPR